MVRLDVDDVAGTVDDIAGGTGAGAGEAQLGHGLRSGLDRAGGRSAREGRAVIAAPGNLGQLPPVAPRGGDDHLNIAEALHRGRNLIGGGDRRAAAAGISADGRPVVAVGGELDIGAGAVVAVRRGRNLNGVEADLRAQIHAGVHTRALAAGRPIIGGGVAVNQLGRDAVVAAVGIAGDGGRRAGGIADRRARALHPGQLRRGNGSVARPGNGRLALQRIGLGALADFQGHGDPGQLDRIAVAAAGAGIDRVALVVRRRVVMPQRRNLLGVALAAVGAGIGHAARCRATGLLRGRLLVIMDLRRGIRIQGAVGIEAAGHHCGVQIAGVGVAHGEAHGPERKANLLRLLCLGLGAGIVAPHAEHAAKNRGRAQRRAADLVVAPIGGIGIAVVKIVILAEDIIEVAGGVDNPEAVADQIGRRAGRIPAPAAGPVADHDVLIKGIGRGAHRRAGLVGERNAVVKGDGRHARGLDHGGDLVHILDEVAVLAAALETAEAHAAGGIAVVGVLICAEIKVVAALAREIRDVFLGERLRKRDGCAVGHINRPRRAVVAAGRPRERGRRIQDGIHVTRGVEERDNLDAGGIGRGQNLVHLALSPLAGGRRGIGLVARLNGGTHGLAAVGRAVHRERHVVEQEAHSVVANGEHDVRKAVRLGLVDECLDPVHGKIFAAAVQHGNLHVALAVRSQCRGRQHAENHAGRQQQCQELFPFVHCVSSLGELPLWSRLFAAAGDIPSPAQTAGRNAVRTGLPLPPPICRHGRHGFCRIYDAAHYYTYVLRALQERHGKSLMWLL